MRPLYVASILASLKTVMESACTYFAERRDRLNNRAIESKWLVVAHAYIYLGLSAEGWMGRENREKLWWCCRLRCVKGRTHEKKKKKKKVARS